MANNTPAYQGTGQPAGNGNGWLGRFGNFFGGGSTPAYLGDGQPAPGSAGGILNVATPAYRPASVVKPKENAPTENASAETAPTEKTSTLEHTGMAHAVLACPVDPDPFGSGSIAIVIPRQG